MNFEPSRRAFNFGAAAALAQPFTWRLAFADHHLAPIRLISFPGTYNILVWAGHELGFFGDGGMEVTRTQTPTSMYLARNVVAGNYDIAIAAIDNVVAYNEGQGQVPVSRASDMFAFMSVAANTELPLLVQGDVDGFKGLRGTKLAVDAISTGFSFVLRKILEVNGLGMDDYELVSVGSARARLEALVAGEYAGAILTPPFNVQAKRAGLKTLGTSAMAFAQYQATCFLSTRRWAADHGREITHFIGAILKAAEWIQAEGNAPRAGEILRENMPNVPEAAAGRVAVGAARNFSPDLNMAGIRNVLALRSEYAQPARELTDPAKYYDLSYLEKARG